MLGLTSPLSCKLRPLAPGLLSLFSTVLFQTFSNVYFQIHNKDKLNSRSKQKYQSTKHVQILVSNLKNGFPENFQQTKTSNGSKEEFPNEILVSRYSLITKFFQGWTFSAMHISPLSRSCNFLRCSRISSTYLCIKDTIKPGFRQNPPPMSIGLFGYRCCVHICTCVYLPGVWDPSSNMSKYICLTTSHTFRGSKLLRCLSRWLFEINSLIWQILFSWGTYPQKGSPNSWRDEKGAFQLIGGAACLPERGGSNKNESQTKNQISEKLLSSANQLFGLTFKICIWWTILFILYKRLPPPSKHWTYWSC